MIVDFIKNAIQNLATLYIENGMFVVTLLPLYSLRQLPLDAKE